MLNDPKSDALIANFASEWLQLRNMRGLIPDPNVFPDFDDNLRQAFVRGDRASFRKHLARGSQRHGLVDGGLYVCE